MVRERKSNRKGQTYNGWNRRGGFKQLFHSCAVDWNGQLIYEATRRLYYIIQYVAGMADSMCKISDLTQEINFLFCDQAAWTWTESFVAYCGEKNPTIELVPRFQRYDDE
jgi:hypothetical protein